MTGPVPVTVATATKGSIGVYLDAIGTVTPVYLDWITANDGRDYSGSLSRGPIRPQSDALIDIDSRPYAAQLLQAQGALSRDQSLLEKHK